MPTKHLALSKWGIQQFQYVFKTYSVELASYLHKYFSSGGPILGLGAAGRHAIHNLYAGHLRCVVGSTDDHRVQRYSKSKF